VLVRGHGTDDHGLEHTDLGDAALQLGQVVLVEDLPRLAGIRPDLFHREVGEQGTRNPPEPWHTVVVAWCDRFDVSRETVPICRLAAWEEDVAGSIRPGWHGGNERPQPAPQAASSITHCRFLSGWLASSAAASR
jgi:hypothetical protein